MTSPAIDPLRLNVAHFAADAQEAEGDWAIAELPRLADSECPVDAGSPLKARADAPALPSRASQRPHAPRALAAPSARTARWAARTRSGCTCWPMPT